MVLRCFLRPVPRRLRLARGGGARTVCARLYRDCALVLNVV